MRLLLGNTADKCFFGGGGLAARILGGQSSPRRPRIRSVRTELTMSGACEATVLLEEGNRVRAAAARLELLRERWILTGLEMA